MKNEFTKQLLNYSAERDDCIGRPDRWGDPPPLVVKTPLHDEMVAFAEEVWNGSDRLIWYFLVILEVVYLLHIFHRHLVIIMEILIMYLM